VLVHKNVQVRIRVRVMGRFEVEGIADHDLGSRKGRTLLKVLALARGRPVSVHRIADVLWGDAPPSRPADQVAVLVSRLRSVVGAERISRSDEGYALLADWLDLDELDELASTAASALADGRVGVARAAAGAALALTRGALLPDEDGEWAETERAALDASVRRVRRVAVDAAVAAGDHDGAASLAEQALAADPYDEVLLRALIRAHLAARRPASALAAYARVRTRLAEDLGVPPTAETEALHATALAAADGDGVAGAIYGADFSTVVGRGGELAILDAALSMAAAGGTALVIVEGDAGIGKTTVVDGWSRLINQKAAVLRGRCDELGRDLPLQPVADALAEHLRVIGAERAALIAGDDSATLGPLLAPLAGAGETVVADLGTARARLFAALVSVLGRLSEERPLVLLIEDLHLAGAGTRAWLAFAQRRALRTLVVVTTRPGGARGLDPTHSIRLGPLDRDAVAELVGPQRAPLLYERSGGHPLLLTALAASGDEAMPASLREAVATQVDSLGDDVATTLRTAAVLGPECDLELLAQVSSTPAVDVLTRLEAAMAAGVVVESGSRFGFRHELVREAIAATTGSARRALTHQLAARVLASRPHADPLAVAIHARAGGDKALASSSFLAAGVAAARRFDLDAAEELVAAALDLIETAAAYGDRARLRMGRSDFDAAASDAERAIAMGGGASALEAAGWVAYYRRRYDEARAYADEAASRAEDRAVRVSALALAGRVRHGAGDVVGAVERLTAVRDGPPRVQGIADVWLAGARLHQGRPAEALDALARPMVDPDGLAHPWAPLHLRFYRIVALGQMGRPADALRVADELDAAVGRTGPIGARFGAPAANARAWILRWSGRAAEADESNRRAFEITGGESGPAVDALAEAHYVALLDLADGCLLRSDLGEAAALATRLAALDSWQGTMAWHQRHRLGLLRARLALADGDPDAAQAYASAVADDAASRGAGRYELLARAVTGLADRTISRERLNPVIEGLGACAVLDGWPLVSALAAAHRCDRWRAQAEQRAAAVVAAAGDDGGALLRFATPILMA
jgi:DNA-binding SARP family transcriptional activator